MTMILMERMKKALMLALVLLMILGGVSATAEELDFVVLEAVDDYEEVIQLIEMEADPEPEEPEQEIELIDLVEIEEPEPQEQTAPEEQADEAAEFIQVIQEEETQPQQEEPIINQADPMELTVEPQTRYGVANQNPIAVDVAVAGGAEPVILTATVSLDGQIVSTEQIPAGAYSFLPWQGGQHTVTVTAQDAEGSTVSAQATVPVSAGEYDIDSYNYWVGCLPQLTADQTFAEKLLEAAASQIGCKESNDYFIIDGDGVRHGYTVYGDWYGKAYAEWNAIFVNFCLEAAGIPQDAVPRSADSAQWIDKLGERFVRRGSYRPQPGDLVFFTDTANGEATRVAIVSKTIDGGFAAIGGTGKAVTATEYNLGDPSIVGFMKMQAVMETYDPQFATPTPVPTAVPTPEPTVVPTPEPTAVPTPEPTAVPTLEPTPVPTVEPTPEPTAIPEPEEPEVMELVILEEEEPQEPQAQTPVILEMDVVNKEPAQQAAELVNQEKEPSKEGQLEEETLILLEEEEEAVGTEENASDEPLDQLPLLLVEEIPEEQEPVVLQASLTDSDYKVVVRFGADSGIPADAQLTVTQILDQERYGRYLETARNMLDEEERADLEEFYLLSISLISGGVDYASQGGYEVEIVLNDAIEAEGLQAMSFRDDLPTRLQTNTVVNADETIDRISFNSH